jgi:hypothetical protein
MFFPSCYRIGKALEGSAQAAALQRIKAEMRRVGSVGVG